MFCKNHIRFVLGFVSFLAVTASTATSTAAAAVLPKEAATLIQTAYPGSKMVSVVSCELGLSKTPSYGLVVLKKDKGLTDADVAPMIVTKIDKTWRFTALEKGVSVEGAFVKSFTDEAIEKNEFNKNYRIKCVQPKRGEEIGEPTGQYVQSGLSDDTLRKSKHLCFQASTVYNNWICFNYESKIGNVKQSFAQFHAD